MKKKKKDPLKLGFLGTDGRTLLAAIISMLSTSEHDLRQHKGIVVRGTGAMQPWAESREIEWPIGFLPVPDNSADAYAAALIEAFGAGALDIAMVLPEGLLFEGLVDRLIDAGHGDRVIGLSSAGADYEADKIVCKRYCDEAGVPVAPEWTEVDARNYKEVLAVCLAYIDRHGGVVLKYPYGAGGKGSRIILNTWQIKDAYNDLLKEFKDKYKERFGKKSPWPLLIEARMSGVEISFTVLVDGQGHYQILPTAMDYPERFDRPPGLDNPISGGMGSISPHPMESPALLELAGKTIIEPLIEHMRQRNVLRPCVLYPGCFVSFDENFRPTSIRVCEVNIRPGEPEFQSVLKLLRNFPELLEATSGGYLNEVVPEVRTDQVSVCIALVTGPGGPQQQKGYPWSLTKGEVVKIDWDYFKKKRITIIPSAMDYVDGVFKSDGSRVAYLLANAAIKGNQTAGQTAEILRQRMLNAFDNGKIRVIPREDDAGNRLALRRSIGTHYGKAEALKVKT
ncbi:MAG: hypothetical protein WC831_03990 [Parcubacteria group bacterium]|jgi:phosphoribosylamine--glycine ligase